MISIITPVLNGSKFIADNIESIQKLKIPYEHIIVDGGSSDGTLDIIKKYSHVKLLIQTENNGMYGAIHQGFMQAKGKYITWVNSDDAVIPEGYSKLYSSAQNKNADFAYSHGIHHFVEKYYYKKHYARYFVRYLLKNGVFPFVQPSVIFTLSAYKKIGSFNYKKFRLIGDRDLFQRMAYDNSLKFLFVPVFSSIFLRYENSLLYRNLEQRKLEYKYCISSDVKFYHRAIFHLSQLVRNLVWKLKN
jgi:glycosyltransferase involved in cell wall biosynthesis